MKSYRQTIRNRRKGELPRFLADVTTPPDDLNFNTKPKPSVHYLGPIFFGLCGKNPHHAPPHSLKLGSFHQPPLVMFPGTDAVSGLLYPATKPVKKTYTVKTFHPRIRHQKTYPDTYPHVAPGVKSMFVPEVVPHVVDIGKSSSIIEGEASLEIPFSRYPHSSSRLFNSFPFKRKSKTKSEKNLVLLSDIREEKRIYLSYKERIAHAHFPKEFTTVRIIGPPIPASITVTKLPSKRKTGSELTLELKRKSGDSSRRRSTEIKSGKSMDVKSRVTITKSGRYSKAPDETPSPGEKSDVEQSKSAYLTESKVRTDKSRSKTKRTEEDIEEEGEERSENSNEKRLLSEEGAVEEAGEDAKDAMQDTKIDESGGSDDYFELDYGKDDAISNESMMSNDW